MSNLYGRPKFIDKLEFLEVVSSEMVAPICDAIVRAAHYIDDYDWLLQQYRLLLKHPDPDVRGVAVTCVGHLARLNQHARKDELLGVLEPLMSDADLVGRVEDAVDDINTFL